MALGPRSKRLTFGKNRSKVKVNVKVKAKKQVNAISQELGNIETPNQVHMKAN